MTFAELIYPVRSAAIHETITAAGATVARWRKGLAWPEAWQIVPLAELLRVDVAELAQIIHDDVTGGGADEPS